MADKVADKLVAGMAGMVNDMAEDRDHEMRQRIGAEFERLILRLEDDPSLRERVNAFRDQLIEDSDLSRYIRGLWRDLTAWIREDVERDESAIAARIEGAGREIGARLAAGPAARAVVVAHIAVRREPQARHQRFAVGEFRLAGGALVGAGPDVPFGIHGAAASSCRAKPDAG